jgi:hypothetical protein
VHPRAQLRVRRFDLHSSRELSDKHLAMGATVFRFLLLIGMVAALTVAAQAQIQNGTVTGVVSDPTGALIANAVVRLDHPVRPPRKRGAAGS